MLADEMHSPKMAIRLPPLTKIFTFPLLAAKEDATGKLHDQRLLSAASGLQLKNCTDLRVTGGKARDLLALAAVLKDSTTLSTLRITQSDVGESIDTFLSSLPSSLRVLYLTSVDCGPACGWWLGQACRHVKA